MKKYYKDQSITRVLVFCKGWLVVKFYCYATVLANKYLNFIGVINNYGYFKKDINQIFVF